MATVRMSDGLKDIMFRQMRKINPSKEQKNMPQSWADAAYKIWLTTEQGELVCEMAQRKLAREMFLKEVARIRVSSVNGETLWGTVGGNSGDKFYVPKDSGYTEFSIRIDCDEANWIAEAIRAHQAENKAISAENMRVEKEIMAMLNCAPTLNGVLKKYPFLRELVPDHVKSKLAEKVKRVKKDDEEEATPDDEALAIQRKLKIGIIANKVSGE